MFKSSPCHKKEPSSSSQSDHESEPKCPICSKNFPVSSIEAHVNKCLFLNSKKDNDNREPNKDKRKCEEEETFIPSKRFSGNKGLNENPCTSLPTEEEPRNVSSKMLNVAIEGSAPLAEQMRPSSFEGYIGQTHVLGPTTLLRSLLDQNEIPSMILWGPPGCGKTSLAHIISKQCQAKAKTQCRFVKLSATMAGVSDVKDAIKVAKNELAAFKRRTILFMDEIHRFNKLQQDIFLPHVESGCIILIGATTENPSFSLNSALLSRCRVFVLEKLSAEEILGILTSAAERLNLGVSSEGEDCRDLAITIDRESLQWLAEMCDGDARIALNSLHMALKTCSLPTRARPVRITPWDIKEGIKRSHLLYDRKGEEHYNIISALHKSIRASDEDAALYWLARMLEGGEDPVYIARRLVVCASEDIGMKDPHALTMAMSAMQACQSIGMPECGLFLAHVSTYLARAPKSREVYDAFNAAKRCVREHKGALPSVPLHLRNAPTELMKNLGSSRITRLTRLAARLAADRKEKNPTSKTNDAVSVAKSSRTKQNCVKKPSSPQDSTPSVFVVDVDTNDNDNLFDGCQPGTSVYQSSKVNNKASKNVRLSSLDLDEQFPIQWSGRKNKTTKASENVPELEDVNKDHNENVQTCTKKTVNSKVVSKHVLVSEENVNELEPLNNIGVSVKGDQIYQEKENIIKKKKDIAKTHVGLKKKESNITGKSKNTILNGLTSKESRDANPCNKQVSNGEDKSQVMVSRFEEVVFKVSNASGGIIAKCLRTDNNDIGYLEVVPDQVFNGQSTNITFVVIEGKAKVLHLGTQQILSPGDMIHICSDSGYQFESAEKGHVRFLYIKVH